MWSVSDIVKEERRRERERVAAQRRHSVDGQVLHIYDAGDGWECWLNNDMDFDGTCIGVGATEDAAVADAVRTLEALAAKLQELPQ